jgi:phage tail-like protein
MTEDTQHSYYPQPPFLFEVSVDDVTSKDDCCFQEIGDLNVDIKADDVKEAGVNTFSHKPPGSVNDRNLVLKRGLIKGSSLMLDWFAVALEQFVFSPRNVVVTLLDRAGIPLATWSFQDAYPVAVKIGDFKAMDNAYVIETLEFAFNSFERKEVS